MKNTRRRFLQAVGTTTVPLTVGPIIGWATTRNSDSPKIPESDLEEYGWSEIETPRLPDGDELEEGLEEGLMEETNWEFAAYADTAHRSHIKEKTDGKVDLPFKQIWATKVSTTDKRGRQIKWKYLKDEADEVALNVDGATEKVFQFYATNDILGGNLEMAAEVHRKAVSWAVDIPSYIPYVGPAISYGIDFIWDAQTSINFSTGGSAYLSQYLFGFPTTKESLGVSNEPTDVNIDFRGWYVDWMKDGDFHAAGGVYPQNAEELSDQLGEAFKKEVDLNQPDKTYGKEVLELLSNIE